jgi:hypothetical protein
MSYIPLWNGRTSPHPEDIEINTLSDRQTTCKFAPSQGPLDDNIPRDDDSTSFFYHSNAVYSRPSPSQRVAAFTPFRGAILAFDIILASSPLIFIGIYLARHLSISTKLDSFRNSSRDIGRQRTRCTR